MSDRILLDTNVLLWLADEPERLRPEILQRLETVDTLLVSAASIWEIVIKAGLGRLEVSADMVVAEVERSNGTLLPVTALHAIAVKRLPQHHRDPFDRMIVAQALCEVAVLVSPDRLLQRYGIEILSV